MATPVIPQPWNGSGYTPQSTVELTVDELLAVARVLNSLTSSNVTGLSSGADYAAFTRAKTRIDAVAEDIINAERGEGR